MYFQVHWITVFWLHVQCSFQLPKMPYAWHMVPVLSSTPIAGISRLLTFPNEIQTSSESFSTHVVTINQSELVGKMKVTSHLCTSTICIVFVFFFCLFRCPWFITIYSWNFKGSWELVYQRHDHLWRAMELVTQIPDPEISQVLAALS